MQDRRAHWEHIYTSKSPQEVSWYQAEPRVSLDLIRGIARSAPVIDVGGGASTLVDHLHRAGYSRIAVLDISARALALARQRLGSAVDRIEWFEADVTDFTPPHRFALWHDRAVFHFLTDPADRRRYRETLHHALQPDGQVIIAAFAPGGPAQCSGLDVAHYDAPRLIAELGTEFHLEEQRNEAHRTPAGKDQLFNFFRLRRVG